MAKAKTLELTEDQREHLKAILRTRTIQAQIMNRQIDLILETDWTTAFSTPPASFGKVDAAFMIRKSLGSMRSFA